MTDHAHPSARRIGVFAASSDAIDPVYRQAAQALGAAIGRQGLTLVYGGGNIGLMGICARAVREYGGRVVGVIPRRLADLDLAWKEADELIFTADLRDRKAKLETLSDGFIALPGGPGTLDELFEVLALKQLGYLDKPVVLLNADGFFDPLLAFLGSLADQGFMRPKALDLFSVTFSAEAAVAYVTRYVRQDPPPTWF
ncbi:MAG TPA: TIGR00730 family Rossman fold protein [Candidatus Hydrogenedentes bacterium]|nr:TIGR00730 family Rossman fold protein [Candidatus Hydrogenedentota bacterium]